MLIIACIADQFTMNNMIELINTETGTIAPISEVFADDVGHTIATYAHEHNIYNIAFGGAPEAYLERFIDDVYVIYGLMYGTTDKFKFQILEGDIE